MQIPVDAIPAPPAGNSPAYYFFNLSACPSGTVYITSFPMAPYEEGLTDVSPLDLGLLNFC